MRSPSVVLRALFGGGDRDRWRRRLRGAMPFLLAAGVVGALALGLGAVVAGHGFTLARPRALWALLTLLPVAWLGLHRGRRREGSLTFSRVGELQQVPQGLLSYLAELPRALRVGAVGLIAVALARPQVEAGAEEIEVEGIDVVVALDLSLSMEEHDLAPDRLEAAKRVLDDFVARRPNDRIGLVVFGADAFTHCPLTLDHAALRRMIADLHLGVIDGRGTAIGDGLGVALNRLRRSDADTKVVILLTDGDNNSGRLDPEYAARLAQSLEVKIFTILMGRPETQAGPDAPDPAAGGLVGAARRRHPVNPQLLERIAGATGGTPYLASDTEALRRRFHAILEELDKSRLRDRGELYADASGLFVWPALALVLLDAALALTRFRRFP